MFKADYSVKKISHEISLWYTFFFVGEKKKKREALNIIILDAHFFLTCIKKDLKEHTLNLYL